jgi:uncharacterized phage infection (PIP) family protein YhgE
MCVNFTQGRYSVIIGTFPIRSQGIILRFILKTIPGNSTIENANNAQFHGADRQIFFES